VKRFAPAAILLVLIVAGDTYAQVEDVQPPHPTSVDYIVLRVGTATIGMPLHALVINGSTIEITFRGDGVLTSTVLNSFRSAGSRQARVSSVLCFPLLGPEPQNAFCVIRSRRSYGKLLERASRGHC
jgi:hypothetical protein